MTKDQIIIMSVFAVYLLLMVGIGFVFYRKKMSTSEYMLGGRNLNPWVTAMSAQASDMSGWLLTGVPGMCCVGIAAASVSGIKDAVFLAIGLLIGTMCNWIFVAKRLRVYTEVASNSITVPSFFENRYDDKKGVLQTIAGVVILFFFTIYAASMFSAGAKLFDTIFGLDYHYALLLGAGIIVIYTLLGGFLAVSWTDLIQGLIMFFALILVPALVIKDFTSEQFSALAAIGEALGDFMPVAGDDSFTWVNIVTSLSWGLGYFGMPHILVRFMATKDKRTIKPATGIAMIWAVITMACAILIGIVGRVALGGDVINDANSETVFMELVNRSFHPVVAGILLSAILAAIMSTADSQLLVASSSFAENIYKRHIRKDASDKETLAVSRLTIIALAAAAILIALDPASKIFELVEYAWGGFGAAFGPLVLFSLYSDKLKRSGAIASIVTGAVVSIAWRWGVTPLAETTGIAVLGVYELVPGFICASIALWTVSLLDKRPISDKMRKDYDNYKALLKNESIDTYNSGIEVSEMTTENTENVEKAEVVTSEENATFEDQILA